MPESWHEPHSTLHPPLEFRTLPEKWRAEFERHDDAERALVMINLGPREAVFELGGARRVVPAMDWRLDWLVSG